MPASRPIQVQPQALLGLLQLKNSGRNPEFLGDTVTPIIDLGDWYRVTNDELLPSAQTPALAAIGTAAFSAANPNSAIVPGNEWWYVTWATLSIAPGAGEALNAQLVWRANASLGGVHALTAPVAATASTANLVTARDFWLPPGAQILVNVVAAPTLTPSAFLNIRRTRMQT